jgi:hypothetical protein
MDIPRGMMWTIFSLLRGCAKIKLILVITLKNTTQSGLWLFCTWTDRPASHPTGTDPQSVLNTSIIANFVCTQSCRTKIVLLHEEVGFDGYIKSSASRSAQYTMIILKEIVIVDGS